MAEDPPAAPSPAEPRPGPVAPRLARGLRVVRRGRDRLQVGLHPDRRTALRRTPVVERTLLDLLHGTAPGADPETLEVLARLRLAGCLAPGPRDHVPAVALVEPGRGPGAADRPTTGPRALLEAAGLRLTPWSSQCDVALVVSWSELDRDVLDPLVRSRTPHLVVRLVDGGAVLGPFVDPGVTACLRCIDAHLSTHDPDHVAVTARYIRAVGARDVADVADHLAAIAVSWAVRDVLAHLSGVRPATRSATWHLTPDGGTPTVQEWHRHPGCGCCWAADARPSGTMES
ncbi:MAG: hypothetical protein JWR42_2832 [Marmoricola sp.]|nr:hypothetical protein [Marmoricola sp.]